MQLVIYPIDSRVTVVFLVDICITVARKPVSGEAALAQSSNFDSFTIGCYPRLLSCFKSVKFDPSTFLKPSKVSLVVKHWQLESLNNPIIVSNLFIFNITK